MKKNLQLASSTIQATDQEWIQLFRPGVNKGYDGRGPYIVEEAEKIIAASLRESVDLMIDRDHQLDLLPPGTPVRAAGWIKELQARADGIWARVEWTDAAKAELAAKEYRYISPVFMFDKETSRVTQILRASLTNNPNLELKAVASAQLDDPQPQQETKNMDENLTAIAALLGMSGEEDGAKILEAVKKMKEKLDELYNTTGETASSTVTAILAAAVKKAGAAQPDPSKFVPIAQFDEMKTQLASIQKTIATDKALAAVDEAVTAGKVTPAQKEWATGYATKDPEGFAKYIAGAPVIASQEEVAAGDPPAGKDGSKLDRQQKTLCTALGLKEEDFAKQNAAA